MKKIKVTKDLCIGCGACVAIDPTHFNFDDDGKSQVITNENFEDNNLINAIESCPTSAIEIIEENSEEISKEASQEVNHQCDCTENDCKHCKNEKDSNQEVNDQCNCDKNGCGHCTNEEK